MRRLSILALAAAVVVLAVLVAVAAIDSGSSPQAPPVGALETDCFLDVCAEHPTGWDVEVGETFLAFSHPLDPERVLGSVGRVNMEALITNTGGTWPAPPEDAARAFFELLGENQDAGLEEGPEVLADGSVVAAGELEGLLLWYRLIPADGPRAIGVEVRAPNDSWQAQADAWRAGVTVGVGS